MQKSGGKVWKTGFKPKGYDSSLLLGKERKWEEKNEGTQGWYWQDVWRNIGP